MACLAADGFTRDADDEVVCWEGESLEPIMRILLAPDRLAVEEVHMEAAASSFWIGRSPIEDDVYVGAFVRGKVDEQAILSCLTV